VSRQIPDVALGFRSRPERSFFLAVTEPRGILFDLDGTLLDSFQSHLEIYQATLARFGIVLTLAEFRQHYTPDWNEFYRAVGLPPERWNTASDVWLREAATHQPQPFPGVAATLSRLRERFRLGLVTAGSRSRVDSDITRSGIAAYLDVVVTADDVREPKPAPDGLRAALRLLDLSADEALYVGDTESDYEFSRAAGVAFVGVASEFSRPQTHDGYVRLASVTELPAFLGAQ
jgi:HAD superfamily hydrolase (TIGR01509 family)